MIAICYTDDQGVQRYTTADELSTFTDRFPTATVDMYFDTLSDIKYQTFRKDEDYSRFASMCEHYGFDPSDYHRKLMISSDSDIYQLVGFIPENHKYTCRITSATGTMKSYRMSPENVRLGFKRYYDHQQYLSTL